MSTYFEKLKDPRWQKKRLCVMKRDEFKCRDCGDEKRTLHVHHCLYERGDPWETNDSFLLTLCEDCHEWRQQAENSARRALAELFTTMDGLSIQGVVSFLRFARETKEAGKMVTWKAIEK